MELSDLIASETSNLARRIVAGVTEKSDRDLEALRQALGMVTEAIDGALASRRDPDYDAEVAQMTERLSSELTSRADAARVALERALDEARASGRATAEVREALEVARAQTSEALTARDHQAAECQALTETLARATSEAQAAAHERQELVARVQLSIEEIQALRRAADQRDQSIGAAQSKLHAANATIATLRQRAETAERETRRVRGEAELAAQASVRAARAVEDVEARSAAMLVEQADTIRTHATAFLSMSLDRLLATYLSVSSAATVDDVLAALVDALSVQFSRVALFRVQSMHLEGVRQIGFDLRSDISQVLIPRTVDALANHAVTSARIETRSAADPGDHGGMPLGGHADFALALPIVIDGQVLAVIYADAADNAHRGFASPELRVKYAQVLQCHAVPLLSRLAAEEKAVAELDEYAAMLVHELEQTHAADLEGTPDGERHGRLRDNIEYARQLFAQRASAEGPRAAALFEHRLTAAAEGQNASAAFARDIAAAAGSRLRDMASGATGRQQKEAAASGA